MTYRRTADFLMQRLLSPLLGTNLYRDTTIWGYWFDISFLNLEGWSLYTPPNVTGEFFLKRLFMAILPSACKGEDVGSSAVRSCLSVLQFRVVLCCLDLHKNPLLDTKDVQSENGHACVYRAIH